MRPGVRFGSRTVSAALPCLARGYCSWEHFKYELPSAWFDNRIDADFMRLLTCLDRIEGKGNDKAIAPQRITRL